MYSITYGDDLLYDPLDGDAYPVSDVSLSAEINGSGSCEFSIPKTHPLYDVIDLYDTDRLVTVTEDSHILFKGYVASVDEDEYGVRTYSCTGILSFLKKSVVRPYSTDAEDEKHVKAPSTIDGFFNWLIFEHGNHTDRGKRFIVGRNEGDIVRRENVIHASSDSASTTADVLQSELLDGLGGYVFVRYGDDGVTYLDYLSECRDTNAQVIDFGVNLVSYSRTDDATDVATVCYAKGGTPKKDEGSDKEKPPVDLTKYPDGPFARGSYRFEKSGDRIICLDLVDKYGYSEMTFEDSDLLDPYELLDSAAIALLKQLEPKITIDIRAIDLSLFMDGYEPLRCGELVRVRSDPNGFDSYMLVSGMDLDLENPENTEYTLGTTFDAFTGESNKIIRQLNATINKSADQVASLDQTAKDQAIQIGSVEQAANQAQQKAADLASELDGTKATVEQVVTEQGEIKATVSNAAAKADQSLQVSTSASQTATQAQTTATSAYRDAQSALTQSSTASQTANAVKTELETKYSTTDEIAEQYATKSLVEQTSQSITSTVEATYATKSEVKQTSDSLTVTISSAISKAESAATAASNAQNTANTANRMANTANSNAQNAQSTANTAIGNAQNANNRVGNLETCIKMTSDGVRVGKTDNGEFTGYSALVNSAGSFDILDSSTKTLASFNKDGLRVNSSSDRGMLIGFNPNTNSGYIGSAPRKSADGDDYIDIGMDMDFASGGNLSVIDRLGRINLIGNGIQLMTTGNDRVSINFMDVRGAGVVLFDEDDSHYYASLEIPIGYNFGEFNYIMCFFKTNDGQYFGGTAYHPNGKEYNFMTMGGRGTDMSYLKGTRWAFNGRTATRKTTFEIGPGYSRNVNDSVMHIVAILGFDYYKTSG